jgi:hypothetical protein
MSFDLFNLLPAVYRIRDYEIAQSLPLLTPAEKSELAALQVLALNPPLSSDQQARLEELTAKASRGPLQSLLMVIQEQLMIMAEDLDQLYDDQFIETCAPWVIPYIGDLIGYQSVKGIAPAIDNPRAEVAETISFRRRKGTVLVMEQLARDATAWGAHAVEFFRVLADTQYVKNHLRLWNHYAPDLHCWKAGLYIDTGFDRTAHKVDVRRIEPRRGRHNIQNIGIFLWSMNAYSITEAQATPAPSTNGVPCFRFSALGMDIPLFHRAISQGEQITQSAEPSNVADRLRRRVLCDDLQKGVGAVYYGQGNSLEISVGGQVLNPYQIQVADLAGADGSWKNVPSGTTPYQALVDPQLGRLVVPPSVTGAARDVKVSYYYGFNADMGGGEYPRAETFITEKQAFVFPFPDPAGRYTDLQGAIDFATAQLSQNGEAAVEITSSQTFPNPAGPLTLNVNLPSGTTLELRAAEATRPTLLLSGEITVLGGDESTFCLNGLVIAANAGMAPASPTPAALVHVHPQMPDSSPNLLSKLKILHCTLVPGWKVATEGTSQEPTTPTLIVEPSATSVIVENSILGAVQTTLLVESSASNSIIDGCDRANVAYSALDGLGPGGPLTLLGCTVVGKVHATLLSLVSDCIFWAEPNKPQCRPVFLSTTPLSSVFFITPPNAAGDTLVVGAPNPLDPTIQQLLNTVPMPNGLNQQICGGVQLAPGLHANAYVPSAVERQGDFSAFAVTFTDPSPGNPNPIVGGVIPPARFGDTFAWRVAPSPSDPWLAPLWADRKQEGCVRFSFLPIGAQTPRQFECVDESLGGPVPIFFTTRYGRPGYLKLLRSTSDAIRRGADDSGEMGAFHFVLGPLREVDLTVRMQEYLPVGLEFGIIYQN